MIPAMKKSRKPKPKSNRGGARPGAGRKPGTMVVMPGSGAHPLDVHWQDKGYVTRTEAARIAGISTEALRKRMISGRLIEKRDFVRPARHAIYFSRHSMLRIYGERAMRGGTVRG